MSDAPPFFIPGVSAEAEEAVYVELARLYDAAVLEPARRVFSITFRADGERCTATVGEQLRGERTKFIKSRQAEGTESVSYRLRVLAIFEGTPTEIITDYRTRIPELASEGATAEWNNPIRVAVRSITYFSVPH